MATLQDVFQPTADAIRSKLGTDEAIKPINFAAKINSIEFGNEHITVQVSGLTNDEEVTVTAKWSDGSSSQVFEGEDLTFEIPVNEYYTISFSNTTGYITPYPQSFKAVMNGSRTATAVYVASEAASIYFDTSIAGSANITGDVNTGAIANICSENKKRCLCKPHPTLGGEAITFLDSDTSNKYSDGVDAALDGSEGDVMVYLPQVSILTEKIDDSTTRASISESPIDGGVTLSPCLIAAYKLGIQDGVARSISGVLPLSNTSQAAFKTHGASKGDGWGIIHWEDHCLLAMLFYAKYGDRNSQGVIGTGNLSVGSGLTGTTDTLGNRDTQGNADGRANSFLGIEAITGWYFEFMEGATISNGLWTITGLDGVSREYQAPTTSGWITKMQFEEGGSIDMIPTEVGGSDSTYYADYSTASTSTNLVPARSNYGTFAEGGVSYLHTGNASSTAIVSFGSRLVFHGTITILEPDEYRAL